jgi:Stress responsive A/B Barrel Domain
MFDPMCTVVHSALRRTFMLAVICCLTGLQTTEEVFSQDNAKQELSPGPETEDHQKVLRHAVFFKFKDSAGKEDVDRVVDAFRALPSKITAIEAFQSGENVSRAGLDDGLTHCFLLSFQDEAGRAAYLPHPDHKAFGAALRPHLEKVFVIDYWGRPQATRLQKELKHAVFLKFKETTPEELVRTIESELADLPSKIDSIKAFEWGTNNSPETHDQGFTHCFMFTFDSEEGLKEYVAHPEHRAAASKLRSNVEQVRVLDFWADDAMARE